MTNFITIFAYLNHKTLIKHTAEMYLRLLTRFDPFVVYVFPCCKIIMTCGNFDMKNYKVVRV